MKDGVCRYQARYARAILHPPHPPRLSMELPPLDSTRLVLLVFLFELNGSDGATLRQRGPESIEDLRRENHVLRKTIVEQRAVIEHLQSELSRMGRPPPEDPLSRVSSATHRSRAPSRAPSQPSSLAPSRVPSRANTTVLSRHSLVYSPPTTPQRTPEPEFGSATAEVLSTPTYVRLVASPERHTGSATPTLSSPLVARRDGLLNLDALTIESGSPSTFPALPSVRATLPPARTTLPLIRATLPPPRLSVRSHRTPAVTPAVALVATPAVALATAPVVTPAVTPAAAPEPVEHTTPSTTSLFVTPENLRTVIVTVSTLAPASKRIEDSPVVFHVSDAQLQRTLWKVRKLLDQVGQYALSLPFTTVPPLPSPTLFGLVLPARVSERQRQLQEWITSVLDAVRTNLSQAHRLCVWLLVDTMLPLEDPAAGLRVGGWVVRRGRFARDWKVRWASLDGPALELAHDPHSPPLVEIPLAGSHLGRQLALADPNLRNAFQIVDARGKKHVFCCETGHDRERWLSAMLEYTELEVRLFVSPTALPVALAFKYDEGELRVPDLRAPTTQYALQHALPTHPAFPSPLLAASTPNMLAGAVFGAPLDQVPTAVMFGHNVPCVVFRCIEYLLKLGAIHHEGVFRLNGSVAQIRALKDAFNASDVDLGAMNPTPDIHTVAGLLKLYLRELPELVLTLDMLSEFRSAASAGASTAAVRFAQLYRHLPTANRDLLAVLFRFLSEVVANQNDNKMSLRNVCIVFSPTLSLLPAVLLPFLVDYDCVVLGGTPVPDLMRVPMELPSWLG